jgi:hypothetical protein
MDSAFAAYERLTELKEGLAAYVQLIAAGPRSTPGGGLARRGARARPEFVGSHRPNSARRTGSLGATSRT